MSLVPFLVGVQPECQYEIEECLGKGFSKGCDIVQGYLL